MDSQEEMRSTMNNLHIDSKGWKRPLYGRMKCNVDGSFKDGHTEATAGWVYQNAEGKFKEAVQARGKKVNIAVESELQAILMALQHCWVQVHHQIVIESDCKKAIDILNGKLLHFSAYNWIREIRWWSQRFDDITFQWVKRENNRPADKLAKKMLPSMSSFCYHHYLPAIITNLLHKDYVVS